MFRSIALVLAVSSMVSAAEVAPAPRPSQRILLDPFPKTGTITTGIVRETMTVKTVLPALFILRWKDQDVIFVRGFDKVTKDWKVGEEVTIDRLLEVTVREPTPPYGITANGRVPKNAKPVYVAEPTMIRLSVPDKKPMTKK